jgi:hypothetical protein
MQQALPSSWTYLGLKIQGDLGPFTCYTSKRGRVVWYLKAPPKEPPSWEQILQQNLFRYVGWAWQALAPHQREQWERVEREYREVSRLGGELGCDFLTVGPGARPAGAADGEVKDETISVLEGLAGRTEVDGEKVHQPRDRKSVV